MSTLANRKVLVVNKYMAPINFTTLEKAMKKVGNTYKDGTPKAVIIDCANYHQEMTWEDWSKIKPSDGEEGMRSPSAHCRIPTIIKVTKYSKTRQRTTNYNRRTVYKRDNFQCQYCGKKPPHDELSMDHVVPKSRGGKTTWENIVVSCVECNARKADRTPAEANMKLIRPPFKPEFNFYPSDIFVEDWKPFFKDILSSAYWNVILENDMDEK